MAHVCNAWCRNGEHVITVLVARSLTDAEIWDAYRFAYAPQGFRPIHIRPATEADFQAVAEEPGFWGCDGLIGTPPPSPRKLTSEYFRPYNVHLVPLEEATDADPLD